MTSTATSNVVTTLRTKARGRDRPNGFRILVRIMGFPGSRFHSNSVRRRSHASSEEFTDTLDVFVKGSELATSLALLRPDQHSKKKKDDADGRDELAVASFEWLRRHPRQFVMLAASCLLYSLIGLYILKIWEEIEFVAAPWVHFPRAVRLFGYSVVLQGILSFLGDVYAPYTLWRRDTVFSTVDVVMALGNTALGVSLMSSTKLPTERQAHLSKLCALFVIAVCTTFPVSVVSFRQRNFQVWVWAHTLWHLIPCTIAVAALYVISV